MYPNYSLFISVRIQHIRIMFPVNSVRANVLITHPTEMQ